MLKAKYIVFLGALALVACKTTSQAPLDDAYYWPDKSAHATHSEPTEPGASSPSIEYTNVQDTTVTIKVKR